MTDENQEINLLRRENKALEDDQQLLQEPQGTV